MRKPPAPPPTPAETPDEAEARLYDALRRGDLAALMALWADEDGIVCVHPGGGRVIGAAAIRASFESIFSTGGIPVQPEQVHRLHWLGGAVHHLVERITVSTPDGVQTAWALATNVYVKAALGWQLVAHHASPVSPVAATLGPDSPSTLH
jgi:ketosteroid isomerase-like protein